MRQLLLRLYPRAWRRDYGDGFAALLRETPLTPANLFDILRWAWVARREERPWAAFAVAATLWVVLVELAATRADITDNALWTPTSPARALALVALIGPLVASVPSRNHTVAA